MHIHRQLREDGLCILLFDREDSPANIFDRATLEELRAHVAAIAHSDFGAKGVLLLSRKPSIFIAGADLKALQAMARPELEEFIALGQETFSALAALRIPTVAAIHGACVGGGLECALACDWRVATPDRTTKIGLPETKLGILPAWGGSMRLPRLIGLPAALKMILAGQTVSAEAALRRGLIDAVVPGEHLLEAALPWFNRGKRPRPHVSFLDRLAAPLILTRARAETLRRTRGHYPAVLRAIEVAVHASVRSDDRAALAMEREAVLDLAASPEAASLIRLFFQQERAKKLAVPGAGKAPRVETAAVIGAGLMGSAIAHWISARGHRVILRDVDATRVAAGMSNIARLYQGGVKKHALTAREGRDGLDRVFPTAVEVPLHQADIVIEAAVEKMPVKQSIFTRLDDLTRLDAILATNTSALSIGELARATRHPERVIGLHFFNPVHQMQLVEVVVAPETAPAVTARVLRFVQGLGKLPVLVKDSPGFVVNRILLPYMVEAAELFQSGQEAKLIDDAMRDFGMPMGPLRLTDEVGEEVAAEVSGTLAAAFPGWMHVPAILPKMIAAGLLGRKVRKGFYRYDEENNAVPCGDASALQSRREARLSREQIARRLVLLMINEAARCLEEKIVEGPGDIDFAMVMGTGFAPFRGGPLRYADTLGALQIVQELTALGAAFTPCALLRQMAQTNARFYEN